LTSAAHSLTFCAQAQTLELDRDVPKPPLNVTFAHTIHATHPDASLAATAPIPALDLPDRTSAFARDR
jgi:hypothetical protein